MSPGFLWGGSWAKSRGELGLEPAAVILIGPGCLVYPEGLVAVDTICWRNPPLPLPPLLDPQLERCRARQPLRLPSLDPEILTRERHTSAKLHLVATTQGDATGVRQLVVIANRYG